MEGAQVTRFESFVNPHLGELLRSVGLDVSFVRGAGTALWDRDGREYLDFVAGYGSVPFGHNPAPIWDAILRHRDSGEPSIVQPSMLAAAGLLAERLLALAPAGLDYVCLTNSGAEAVEAAIKACRAATGRLGIIAAHNSFHGKTLGALSATGAEKYQRAFGAPAPHFSFVPYGDVSALADALEALGEQTAAIILEPIQGEGGIIAPPAGYLTAARALADRHGALLILDEVQTGLGRTGRMFACEEEEVRPDCLTVAKALGGGIVPIGACLMSKAAFSKEFALRHSSTFAGNAFACSVGLATLDLLTTDNQALLSNVRSRGEQLASAHARLASRFPEVVREARGTGLLLGLAFDVSGSDLSRWGRCLGILNEQNMLVAFLASYLLNVEGIRTAPTLNGSNVLRVEPPLTVSEAECARYVAAIERTTLLLAQRNTGALCAHLAGRSPSLVSPPAPAAASPPPAAPRGADVGRFAFLVHPIDHGTFFDFDDSLKDFTPEEVTKLGRQLGHSMEPFHIGSTTVHATGGSSAFGDFICVPLLPADLLDMPPGEAADLVGRAVDIGRDRGAKIVGLGGYTSVVTQGGARVTNRGVAITTGNSFTVVAAIEALDLALGRLGMDLHESEVAIVGAAGAIGGAVASALHEQAGGLVLVGRPGQTGRTKRRLERMVQGWLTRLLAVPPASPGALVAGILAHPDLPRPDAPVGEVRAFAAQLLDENGRRVGLRWSSDIPRAVSAADIIVCTTSSADELILPEHVKGGALLCDMSRPPNVSRRLAGERPDVLVIDGGLVEVPNRPELGFDMGFPRGVAYACIAETMMLALDRHYEHTSIGTEIDAASRRYLVDLSKRYGFRVNGLRSFDRLLDGVDWQRLRRARALGASNLVADPDHNLVHERSRPAI